MENKINDLQFLIYDSDEKTEVIIREETIWATQKSIAELFEVGIPTINKHLKNIFESEELDEKLVISKLEITTQLKRIY